MSEVTTAGIAEQLKQEINRFPVLANKRKEALAYLEKLGLPGNKSEEYRHTPLTRALEKNFEVSQLAPKAFGKITLEHVLLAIPEAITVVFVNGHYSEQHSSAGTYGIEIMPLQKAIESGDTHAGNLLSKYADPAADAFVAWNTVAWTHGLLIRVPDHTVATRPLVIYHIADTSAGQVIAHTRHLIALGRNSELTVIQKFASVGEHVDFSNVVTEASLEENAGLSWYNIQDNKGKHFQFNNTVIYQKSHSRANCFTFTLEGKLIRNNLQLVMDGEGCESHMYGLYLLHQDTVADNHTVADHQKPNSCSNELSKGLMDGNSTGIFHGKIYVRPNAQKTNAFQANRNILLTDAATVHTKPQLEIWADDVKCSHGCTSGQLDEEALFYLQARGIPKDQAQGMLLYAFAGEVLDHVKIPEVKEYLDKIISARLHKIF